MAGILLARVIIASQEVKSSWNERDDSGVNERLQLEKRVEGEDRMRSRPRLQGSSKA